VAHERKAICHLGIDMTKGSRRRKNQRNKPVKTVKRHPRQDEQTRAPAGHGGFHHVFVLDTDGDIVDVIKDVLPSEDYAYRHFTDCNRCLRELASSHCDVLVADMAVHTAGAIDFVAAARKTRPQIPIIVIADSATIQHAVAVMKSGASDFVIKPFDRETLRNCVLTAANTGELRWEKIPDDLTKIEKLILGWLLRGCTNSQIAMILNKSVRTVEDQRAEIMEKLRVESVVDLVKLCVELGVVVLSRRQVSAGEGIIERAAEE